MEDAVERAVVMVTSTRHSVGSNLRTFARCDGKTELFRCCFSLNQSSLTCVKTGRNQCVDKGRVECDWPD